MDSGHLRIYTILMDGTEITVFGDRPGVQPDVKRLQDSLKRLFKSRG